MEEEIKIEFYEHFEVDPLCQDSNNLQEVPDEIGENHTELDYSQSDSEIILQPQDSSDKVEERIPLEKSSLIDESLTAGNEKNENDITNNEMIEEEKWYKLIDSESRYGCKFCNRVYLTVQTLRRHAIACHPSEAEILKEKISKQNRKYHKCHICKMRLKTLNILENHFKSMHSLEKHSYCHKCQAVFEDYESLCNHLEKTHKLAHCRINICLTCGYKTHKVSHFNQHLKIHSQYKTHKCGYCSYSTNNMPNLRIHERIHEKSNKPYKCEFNNCTFSTSTQSALRSHKLKHSKDEHFIYCDKCTYKTVYKQSLKKHMNSHRRNTVKLPSYHIVI